MTPLLSNTPNKPVQVLVIDDEATLADLCCRILNHSGYQAQYKTNPHAAIELLQNQSFDLMVVDLMLPDISGFELLEIGRSLHPEMAALMITSLRDVETTVEALRRNADELLLKPFGADALLVSCRQALDARRQRSATARLPMLQSLLALSRALFAEQKPERLQGLLLEEIRQRLGCQCSAIYCNNVLQASLNDCEPNCPPQPPPALPDGRVLLAGQAGLYYQPQPGQEEADVTLESDAAGGAAQPWSFLALAPLESAERAGFSAAQVELFHLLAEQGAAALENARLHAELEASLERLSQSQQALVQSEKLAVAGRMMASLAHEINNPLQGLKNCLHLAADQQLLPEERSEWLENAHGETERLSNTVGRMLEYYRPEQLEHRPLDLNQILRRCAALARHQAERQGAEIELRLEESLPPVAGVSDQLQQVCLNLILNALEALTEAPQPGHLWLHTRQAAGGRLVEAWFEDDGPGVSAEQRRRMFEPFNSSKRAGLGLGLSISYGIIAAHGGEIEMRAPALGTSVSGNGNKPVSGSGGRSGACFVIALPALQPQPDLSGKAGSDE